MYEQRELPGVRLAIAQRAFAEALFRISIEDERISRRKFTDPLISHLSYSLETAAA
jgi:hypothetical protein